MFLLSISATNYPGGAAISHLHRLAKNETYVHVHIDNLAAQTGVSRFTEINPNWTYCKEEHLTPGSPEMYEYTHLIVEAKSRYSSNLKPYISTHDVIDTIEAFQQISFDYFTVPPVKIKTKPVLFILRRRENYEDYMRDVNAIRSVDFVHESGYETSNEDDDDYAQESAKVTSAPEVSNKSLDVEKPIKEEVDVIQFSKDLDVVSKRNKSVEKLLQIEPEVEQKQSKETQKGGIKKTIRKLISKYRRLKIDDSSTSEAPPTSERISVKKLIQQEKTNVEKEELIKIEQQVIELIENNPNIINKQLIKEKIHSSVMKELTAAIEAPNAEKPTSSKVISNKNTEKKAKTNILDKKSDTIVVAGVRDLPKVKKTLKKKSIEVTESKSKPKIKELPLEKPALDNAIDIYEEIKKLSEEVPEDDDNQSEDIGVEEEEEALEDRPQDMEEKLEYANAQIESIMSILAEIVDTIEVTDDVTEER